MRAATHLLAAGAASLLSSAVIAQSDTPATDSGIEQAGLEHVVVTARRREESLQDVPISVTALSGEALTEQNVRRITDLAVPSLAITVQASLRNLVSFAVRGQRSQESQLLTDPPVGTYFAEVVQPRPYGFGKSLYDIQSVQVLKGVQGTLFGRNMTGGAVLVEPRRPEFDFDSNVYAQVGNFDMRELYGMLNVPIGETLAVRVAGMTHERDGFSQDVSTGRRYDDENFDTFRASLLWRPSDKIESLTIADYFESNEHGTAAFMTAGNFTTGPLAAQEGLRQRGVPVSNVPAQLAQAQQLFDADQFTLEMGAGEGGLYDWPGTLPWEKLENWGVQNKTSFDLGIGVLKNIAGYRELTRSNVQDYDGIPAFLINPYQVTSLINVSEELQLQGQALADRLDYTAGVYYFVEKGKDGAYPNTLPELTILGARLPLATTPASLFVAENVGRGKATTYAAYLAGSYELTDTWSLSAGVRYNYDKREATLSPNRPNLGVCQFDTDNNPATPPPPLDQCSFTNEKDWNATTWDATLQYQPSEATSIYASARRGFRAGGFSLRAQSQAAFEPFDPETVYEYEIGLKNMFSPSFGQLTTSAAVFFQDSENVQRQAPTGIDTNGDGVADTVVTVIKNISAQEGYGGELEANLAFDNGLSVGATYSYVKVDVTKGLQPGEAEMRGIPEHLANLNLTYRLPVNSTLGEITASAGASWQSEMYLDDFDGLPSLQESYALAKLRLSWDGINGSGLGAAFFINNAFDELYRVGVLGLLREVGFLSSVYGEPRNYGFEVSYRF
jgi:iron complex outermembrane recepter protein